MRFLLPVFLVSPLFSVGQSAAPALQISHLTGDFYVFTTFRDINGSPFPSNGMYLVTSSGVVLIDTPWDTTQFQPLLDQVKQRHKKDVVLCIATHSHNDRTAGLGFLRQRGVNTYTTRHTDELSQAHNEKRAEFLIRSDTAFTVGQYSFQTYYPGPGHTPDNIVLWFGKERILYGGCLVKSTESRGLGNIADANLQEWPVTIRKIQQKFGQPKYVIPGHQGWNSEQALEHTLELLERHKKQRQR